MLNCYDFFYLKVKNTEGYQISDLDLLEFEIIEIWNFLISPF
jgi:hypothetical protein